MPKNSYVVGLDIGTKKIAAIIGEITEEKKVEIIGIGTAESRGLTFLAPDPEMGE